MQPTVAVTSLLALGSFAAFGQLAPPAFEVASVKPNLMSKAGGRGSDRPDIKAAPGSLTMRNVNLSGCIQWAYEVKAYQISGPDWLGSKRFDILAKAGGPASEKDLRRMLQALLAERFKLALHRQTKELPVYALVVAKNGPKFHESQSEGETSFQGRKMSMSVQRIPMSQVADFLSNPLRMPVVDMTGLKGRYDLDLDLAAYLPTEKPETPPDVTAIITTALQEQLGLKLESRKATIDMLIIDHAQEVPTEN